MKAADLTLVQKKKKKRNIKKDDREKRLNTTEQVLVMELVLENPGI